MTKMQKAILRHINLEFMPGSVKTELIGEDKVKVTDHKGESMTLTANIYLDIMDADTKEILAVSDLPHDLLRIGTKLPGEWVRV